MENWTVDLMQGDCLEMLKELSDNSVDSIVTDPPYGLEFMGKDWDAPWKSDRRQVFDGTLKDDRNSPFKRQKVRYGVGGSYGGRVEQMRAFQAYMTPVYEECVRVLKPGGWMLVFGGTRTYHRIACAVEDAGFEVRDQIAWAYGSGFPKSKNLDGDWAGWGTALKPAWEPVCVARKPLEKGRTVAANVLEHGTGAINIDGCRVGDFVNTTPSGQDRYNARNHELGYRPQAYGRDGEASASKRYTERGSTNFAATPGPRGGSSAGRWPANLIHDGSDEVLALFPESKGQQGDVRGTEASRTGGEGTNCYGEYGRVPAAKRGDSGSAARFFYCAKASKKDREAGNRHPTVKPTDLMAYLCRLVTPPGGVVLDPFMGSGSTGKAAMREGFRFIGIEKDEGYFEIAEKRIMDAKAAAEDA